MVKWSTGTSSVRPVTLYEAMRSFSAAYTLVELLIALALSLLLLIGVIALLSRVGGAMNDTRAAMNMSVSLHETALLLRHDLERIPPSLATKPANIAAGKDPSNSDGYLEIIEGPMTSLLHPYVDGNGNPDPTAGDTDDIISFTALASRVRGLFATDLRGLIMDNDGELRVEEREAAEITWFMRGNTLYRRVRLIDDQNPNSIPVSGRALRENRLLHTFGSLDPSISSVFPYPLYDPAMPGWYYLRVPILEETMHANWTTTQWKTVPVPNDPTEPNPDIWEQPHFFPDLQDRKSGALREYISTPRLVRAGEDAVLTNVLSFDVKAWCPQTNCFVDFGTQGTVWENGNQPALPNTWDSWTQEGEYAGKLPPYTEPLAAIQIIIRCFDPASRVIKQVTVVHRFGT